MSAPPRTLVVGRAAIEAALAQVDQIAILEAAFDAYSQGRAQVSVVGELRFDHPPGDAHLKAGHIAGDDIFIAKIATGFYDNPRLGLPSSSGVVLVFDARIGTVRAVLLDEGLLTDERTAAAGAVAARYLARPDIDTIAMIGAGIQARLQLKHLLPVTPCRRLAIWARRDDAALALASEAQAMGFVPHIAASPGEAAAGAGLVITATPVTTPLLNARDIAPGAHITAVGSDGPHKGELSDDLLARTDLIVADSLAQCIERGELRRAPSLGPRRAELGDVIAGRSKGRTGPNQITIADLTGVAVQDIVLAKAVLAKLEQDGEFHDV